MRTPSFELLQPLRLTFQVGFYSFLSTQTMFYWILEFLECISIQYYLIRYMDFRLQNLVLPIILSFLFHFQPCHIHDCYHINLMESQKQFNLASRSIWYSSSLLIVRIWVPVLLLLLPMKFSQLHKIQLAGFRKPVFTERHLVLESFCLMFWSTVFDTLPSFTAWHEWKVPFPPPSLWCVHMS